MGKNTEMLWSVFHRKHQRNGNHDKVTISKVAVSYYLSCIVE